MLPKRVEGISLIEEMRERGHHLMIKRKKKVSMRKIHSLRKTMMKRVGEIKGQRESLRDSSLALEPRFNTVTTLIQVIWLQGMTLLMKKRDSQAR